MKALRFNVGHALVSLMLVVSVLSGEAHAVRRPSATRAVPTPRVPTIFPSDLARISRGVVPQGVVTFQSGDDAVNVKDLSIHCDSDGSGILYRGTQYQIEQASIDACRLARFVASGRMVAFTLIPEYLKDASVTRSSGLVPAKRVPILMDFYPYVAPEFAGSSAENALFVYDLQTKVVSLDADVEQGILANLASARADEKPGSFDGSYVNADFHVAYIAHLDTIDGRALVDVEGQPLRYMWSINVGGEGGVVVEGVSEFAFSEERDAQYRAILFFQTVAVLRTLSLADPDGFAAYTECICASRRE